MPLFGKFSLKSIFCDDLERIENANFNVALWEGVHDDLPLTREWMVKDNNL